MSKIIDFNNLGNNNKELLKRKRIYKLKKSEIETYNQFLKYEGHDRFLILAQVGMDILLHRGVINTSATLIKKVIVRRIELDNIINKFGKKSKIAIKSTDRYYIFLDEH